MKSMIQQKRQYPIDFNNSPCDMPCNMNTEVGFTFNSDQNLSKIGGQRTAQYFRMIRLLIDLI